LFAVASTDVRLRRLAVTDVPSQIAASVDTIHGMLTLSDRADSGVLTICCLEIAAWARASGAPNTAVAFAQAGALVSPDLAEAVFQTGTAALAAQQDVRAASWFRRAIALARRERNRRTYTAALVELAAVEARKGNLARAEHLFWRGSRAARRWANPQARARAALGLFRLARQRGDTVTAAVHAISVERGYRREIRAAADVLLDLARFWTEMGDLGAARAALRRLISCRSELPREERLSSWALSARLFAKADPVFSAAAASEAWESLLDTTLPKQTRIAAALDLARAARGAGDDAAFMRAKNLVLALSPRAGSDAIAGELARLSDGECGPGAVQVGRTA
jgi:hypothetical protein